ncbi:hypothetical protein DITRI_Ditri13aG0144200 [Diplodiscus trichospermus]
MEESLLAGRGIVFYRFLEAVPFQGSGDKIKLPPSCFTELSDQGTYAKLQPDGVGFSDLPNHKAILETSLLQHATLSQDDVLTVKYGELTYRLHVLELKPSSSISVLETDIEVDIGNPGVESEMTDQYVLKPLVFGTSDSGLVDEGNYLYYKFSIDDKTWEKIVSGDVNIEVKIDAETNSGDTDIYVSKHPLIFPNRHQHQWSSHDVGSNTLILSSKERNLGAGLWHNVVCPHVGCGIVLGTEEAKNHMHCEKCGQAFQLGEMEKHMKVFHEPLRCPCGVALENEDMVQHQASDCPPRLISCQFCGDMVQAGSSAMDVRDRLRGLSEHESICGSRTAPWDSCGRSVMLKDTEIHQFGVHQKN